MQLMGGRFRNLMPSSLLHAGACAVESLPAPGSEYASQMAKGELRRLFLRYACVHPFENCIACKLISIGFDDTITCCLCKQRHRCAEQCILLCCVPAARPKAYTDVMTGMGAITVEGARAGLLGTTFRQTN